MTIRTPDDERKDWLYPPFREGWWYQGATYAGHSDYAVDFNRRTKTGGWLEDTGDLVLAAQDGTVAEVDPSNGLVMLDHHEGLTRTEYRHMTGPFPKVGEKVKRGDRIGSIGNVAGDGRSFGAHLHHVHWRRPSTRTDFRRVQMRFYGKPLEVSVGDSDTRPATWKAPTPVMVQGPQPPATWESAAKDAMKALEKEQDRSAGLTVQVGALNEQVKTLTDRVKELEAEPTDCTAAVTAERSRVLDAVSDGVDELVTRLRA